MTIAAPPIGTLPGVTTLTSLHTPSGRWDKRAQKLIGKMYTQAAATEFKPYLREAEDLLVAMLEQLAVAAGGECGAIEANALATSAWQTAYSRYWMVKAASTPDDTRMVETASRLADAARQNSLAAYELAVRIARTRPRTMADPLEAYTVPIDVDAGGAPMGGGA